MKKIKTVVSLFDGISTGRLVLDMLGYDVENYYASEIEPDSILVAKHHFPEIKQIGDVEKIDFIKLKEQIGEVDLLIGGSPCQNLSVAVVNNIKHNQGLDGEKSSLFYLFLLAKEILKPKQFMLENVASMMDRDKDIISSALDVEPYLLDAKSFSAQNRPRYFWTDIEVENISYDSDHSIFDIKQSNIPEKYWYLDKSFEYTSSRGVVSTPYSKGHIANLDVSGHDILKRVYGLSGKSPTLTTVQGGYQEKKILDLYNGEWKVRKLIPEEYEFLQGLPLGYTNVRKPNGRKISDSKRYSMVGNGWSVPVIKHIFKNLKESS